MAVELSLDVSPYQCDDCTRREGAAVTQLVRVMPRSVVMNGEPVGEEWWACSHCLKLKFPVKKRRRAKDVRLKTRKTTPRAADKDFSGLHSHPGELRDPSAPDPSNLVVLDRFRRVRKPS